MRWAVVVCAVLAQGCTGLKSFDFKDAAGTTAPEAGAMNDGAGTDANLPTIGTIGPVSATENSAGITVTGPGYLMRFSKTDSGFPDQFTVNGIDVLVKAGNSEPCTAPSLTGLQILPAVRADDSNLTPSNVMIVSAGPVMARVSVRWTPSLGTCGNATVVSAWSFFPDGRISRFDHVTGSGTMPATCSCDGGSETLFQVHVETRYAHAVSTNLEGRDNSAIIVSPSGGNPDSADLVCLNNPTFNLMTYDAQGPLPLLYQIGAAATADLGVAYRLGDDHASLDSEYYGQSGMFVGHPATSCQAQLTAAKPYIYYVALKVDGQGADDNDFDGIAGGFTPSGGFGFGVTGNSITFEAIPQPAQSDPQDFYPAPVGFAVGLAFGIAHSSFTVTHGTPAVTLTPDEVKFQPLDNGRVVMWLRDGMPYGDVFTVTGN